jgi:Mycobacterial 4 TMS phage holin, superfamily IV
VTGRLRLSDLARMLLAWAISSLALLAADGLLPRMTASSPWRLVLAAAVTAAFGILVRPALVAVATVIGWLAVVIVAIAGQAIAMHLALLVVPVVEVSAFEVLVGAHGGLGGWQDRGLFVAPTALVAPGTAINGAGEMHGVLVSILEQLGHRTALVPRPRVSQP